MTITSMPEATPLETALEGATHKKRLGFAAWLAIVWLGLVLILGILAPVLPIDHYDVQDFTATSTPPFHDMSHPLGTDSNGHDELSQLIWGGRASMAVGLGVVIFGMVIGGLLGLMAGYFGGWLDTVFSGVFNVLLAFPSLVLALFLVAVLRGDPQHPQGFHLPTEFVLIVGLGIVAIPLLARIARASTLTWAQRDFVLASRAQGSKNSRVLFREVLPNVMPALFSVGLLAVGVAIVGEGTLALLGLGVQLPQPSWGNMIALGQNDLRDTPYEVFLPAMAIFFTVFALNYLGDVIRARTDVRESAL